MKVAVVGGGICGLAAAAMLARDGVQVVVYEKEDALGGRGRALSTLTVLDGTVLLDLCFPVFTHQVTYPDVVEFLENLGVDKAVSDHVSFSVSLDGGRGCQWGNGEGLSTLFAQKSNALNLSFWKMIRDVIKFKNDAARYIQELESNRDMERNETLEQFVRRGEYSELFQKAFLIPTCCSMLWCPSQVMNFSAFSVLSVLRSHNNFQQLLGWPQKHTVKWRLQSYFHKVQKELEGRGCRIRSNSEVHSILTNESGCIVTCKDGLEQMYDCCIIATRASDAVKILGEEATYDELRILGAFPYFHSDIFLHHDTNLMPKNQSLWSSTNFQTTADNKAYITYWLNNIQNIGEAKLPFLVTLSPPHTPEGILFKGPTSCPIPSVAASKAMSELDLIQGKRGLWFCGSYQGYGFLEDRVKAGMLAANTLLKKSCSIENTLKHLVPSWPETVARLLVTRFLERFIASGCLILMEDGGATFAFKGRRKKSNLEVALRVHNPQFYWKVATEGDLGFADAYINGDISLVDKNEGLLNCFQIFLINTDLHRQGSKVDKKRGWWTPMIYTSFVASAKYFFKHLARHNTVSHARKNVSQHYDLSNELFSLFLDDTMSYSCAIFQNPHEDLETAQRRKVHTLIKKARISKGQHVLEIGCGWGGLAFEVVKLTECKYTGVTLSKNQYDYVQQRVKEAGLQDQIELILCDYRELPKGHKYDRIISCEMLEAVGHEYMDGFFRCCESALAPNGILVFQFTAVAEARYDEYRHSPGFMKEYIFPGVCIPSLNRVISSMAAGSTLSVVHLEEIGCHYVPTLRRWREKFLQNQSQVMGLGFDEKFVRTWEYYLDYSAAGFKFCISGNYQIVLMRPGDLTVFGNSPYNPMLLPEETALRDDAFMAAGTPDQIIRLSDSVL
ncbi:uncharacterized protein LOC127252926 [Andrographis paniculata]|uniref:uncharacterized protein LOC127252926 n=1 Tax=Andrographis paniculata TaxID=175694 RepID=UPI0021E91D8F|nr:uncharacterized protein LOC127252926 [Andrographis paniculata]